MLFEIERSKDPRQPYFWRIRSGGDVLAASETYHNKSEVKKAINSVKENAATTPTVDLTAGQHSYGWRFEIDWSRDSRQPYFWRIKSGSEVLAKSETYHNKSDAEKAINSVKEKAATAPMVDHTL